MPQLQQPELLTVKPLVVQQHQQQPEVQQRSQRGHTVAVMRTAHARLLRPSAWIPGVAAAPVPLATRSNAQVRQQQKEVEEQQVPGQRQGCVVHAASGRRIGVAGKAGVDSQDRDQVVQLIAYHAIC